jgi:NAD(P)-dependent dehydrogenase (short-subunit alcohol dehydrogenase family)
MGVDLGLGGKVVLVTGGSDGLGRALCRLLAAEGARVGLCARDAARLEAVAAGLAASSADVLAVPADVSVPADLERFAGAAVSRWGRVDGLVNNAGRSAAGSAADLDDAAWDADLQLKLYAAARAVRLLVPHMADGASIVNTLAISARTPGAGSAPSSVSRAAGMALTKVLSKELGPRGIRANAVLIGLIESGQWDRRAEARGIGAGELYQQMGTGAGIPLGRVGRAEEFADLAAFLLSPRSSYVTGTAISLDGGLSAAM